MSPGSSSCFAAGNPHEAFAAALYARTVERARAADLFEACGIPDTLDGRFDALALHAALVIDRLRGEPDGEALAQAFFDAMFRHLDLTLRELGVPGSGRWPADRDVEFSEGFQGRALAYRAGLGWGAPEALSEALRRNAYGGRPPGGGAKSVVRLEALCPGARLIR